jgi:hypothetical protein
MTFAVLLTLVAAPVAAQQQTPASGARQPGAPAQSGEPSLVFDREVFSYPENGRRDPFQPLRLNDSGPQFNELTLRMIVFSPNPSESLVLVQDSEKTVYRLRRGESVGSATVVDIGRTRVVFSIVEFGMQRQEVLDLKPPQGASR